VISLESPWSRCSVGEGTRSCTRSEIVATLPSTAICDIGSAAVQLLARDLVALLADGVAG
jgi:hypothetical protein